MCFSISACGVSAQERAADRLETVFRESGIAGNSADEYSQYFAKLEGGSVMGVFVIHLPSDHEWREMVRTACERDCMAEYPCDQNDYGVADAGKRKWVPSKFDLPAMAGGGCMLVRIEFDAQLNELSNPKCNGPH